VNDSDIAEPGAHSKGLIAAYRASRPFKALASFFRSFSFTHAASRTRLGEASSA
jgi:hypothetical protein